MSATKPLLCTFVLASIFATAQQRTHLASTAWPPEQRFFSAEDESVKNPVPLPAMVTFGAGTAISAYPSG